MKQPWSSPRLTDGNISMRQAMWAIAAMFVMFGSIGINLWLSQQRPDWPESFGSTCTRKCFFDHLWHSPGLLSGGWTEIAIFISLWIPAVMFFAILYAVSPRKPFTFKPHH